MLAGEDSRLQPRSSANPFPRHTNSDLCRPPRTCGRFTSFPPHGDGATNVRRREGGGHESRLMAGAGKRITGPLTANRLFVRITPQGFRIAPRSGEAKASPKRGLPAEVFASPGSPHEAARACPGEG